MALVNKIDRYSAQGLACQQVGGYSLLHILEAVLALFLRINITMVRATISSGYIT